MWPRRRFLKTAAGSLLPAALPGCGLVDAFTATCPETAAETGGIDWAPDVMHPVFYGFQDYGTTDGAPTPLRVWYPTYQGLTAGPPALLKMCVVRWPVVLFLHGQPPCPDPNYYRHWWWLPSVLAASGYVVVVPAHDIGIPNGPADPDVTKVLGALDWVRNTWNTKWLDATRTAIAGHSHGALTAAIVAQARPGFGAFVGLSGTWSELSSPAGLLRSIATPSFFMWTKTTPETGSIQEDLDAGNLWSSISAPKYGAVFNGQHFDYLGVSLAGCPFAQGPCTFMPHAAADLVALFLSRHLPVWYPAPNASVPVDLNPPGGALTQKQQVYSGYTTYGLKKIATQAGCSIDLRWTDGGQNGTRHIGP